MATTTEQQPSSGADLLDQARDELRSATRLLLAARAAHDRADARLWQVWRDGSAGLPMALGYLDDKAAIDGEIAEAPADETGPGDPVLLALIRTAICDPGQFLPRGEDYTESIPAWSARAVLKALSGPSAPTSPAVPTTEGTATP